MTVNENKTNMILPDWPAPSHIKAYTTVRHSWGHRDEDPKSEAATLALKKLLSMPANPVWLDQVHGTHIVTANQLHAQADGSLTQQPDQICVVLTADCLPVLITNRQGTQVAALHAGWRGLAGGILEKGIQQFASPADLLVWLGPAIGPDKFEVGKDVYDAFTQSNPDLEQAFQTCGDAKWLANLYELARLKLQAQGLTQIYGGDYCTYSQPALFYSYRRDGGKTGRMASAIWISQD